MAEKLTGEGIFQLAQVANVARALLSGPEDFAVRAITGGVMKEAKLAGIESLTAPIAAISSPLATIGKVLGISALTPLGPISAAAGILTSLFGKKKSGPIIANLPPHTIINIIHQKEAIHLFLMSSGAMSSEINRMTQWGTGSAGVPSCLSPNMTSANSISTVNAWLNVVANAWAPGGDDGLAKTIRSINGAIVPGISVSTWGISWPNRSQLTPCLNALLAPAGFNQGIVMRTYGVITGDVSSGAFSQFNMDKFTSAAIDQPACIQERLINFGRPYVCAWQESWNTYKPHLLSAYRAEIGDWMHTVASHPLYKDLIQRMVDIELERKRIRTSNARGAVNLIKDPTVKNIREFVFQPIAPDLVPANQIVPTTSEALGIKQALQVARLEAQEAVNVAKEAAMSITKDVNLKATLEEYLAKASAAAVVAFNSNNAAEAAKAAAEAKNYAAKSSAMVTPGLKQIFEFFKNPNVLIPTVIAASIFILARSGKGD